MKLVGTQHALDLAGWLDDAAKGFVDSIGMQMGEQAADQEKIDELGEFAEKLSEAAALIRRLSGTPPASDAPDLEAIRKRCEAATPGPWENRSGFVRSLAHGSEMTGPGFTVSTQCLWVAECRDGEAFYNPDGNADFIAHARTDIPALLAAIAAPRAASSHDDLETWVRSLPAEVTPKLREAYEFYKKHQGASTGEVEATWVAAKKIADEYHEWTFWGQHDNAIAAMAAAAEISKALELRRPLTDDEIRAIEVNKAHWPETVADKDAEIEQLKAALAQVSTRAEVVCRRQADKWSRRATELAHRGGEAVAQARADMAGELEDEIRSLAPSAAPGFVCVPRDVERLRDDYREERGACESLGSTIEELRADIKDVNLRYERALKSIEQIEGAYCLEMSANKRLVGERDELRAAVRRYTIIANDYIDARDDCDLIPDEQNIYIKTLVTMGELRLAAAIGAVAAAPTPDDASAAAIEDAEVGKLYAEADAAMKAYENWLEETGRDGSDDLRDAFLWGRASATGAAQKET